MNESSHILLVDDSAVILKKMGTLLKSFGYRITEHQSPVQALKWLRIPGNAPNLIILDVSMPDMSGYELTTVIRADPATAHIPIILLTGHTDLEDKVAGYSSGADDYLSKEIEPKELELRIKALLARAKTAAVQPANEATVVSVFSMRGGAGTTSVAVNLAVALAQLRKAEVGLADLALRNGHCSLMLNIKPKWTMTDIALREAKVLDMEVIEQVIRKHPSGVNLLPGPLSAVDSELITLAAVDRIWPYLRATYPFLIVDGGSQLVDPALSILERSHAIILLIAPELASLKSAADTLRAFDQLKFDLKRVYPVINWTFPSHGLAQKDIEGVLGHRISTIIPYDSAASIQAINAGTPVVLADPKSEISQAIQRLAIGINKLNGDRQPQMTLVPKPESKKPKGTGILRLKDHAS